MYVRARALAASPAHAPASPTAPFRRAAAALRAAAARRPILTALRVKEDGEATCRKRLPCNARARNLPPLSGPALRARPRQPRLDALKGLDAADSALCCRAEGCLECLARRRLTHEAQHGRGHGRG